MTHNDFSDGLFFPLSTTLPMKLWRSIRDYKLGRQSQVLTRGCYVELPVSWGILLIECWDPGIVRYIMGRMEEGTFLLPISWKILLCAFYHFHIKNCKHSSSIYKDLQLFTFLKRILSKTRYKYSLIPYRFVTLICTCFQRFYNHWKIQSW